MINFHSGNLLESDAEALVNTVNTVGVMGKGIALQFKLAFPENFVAYERACKRNEVQTGHMFVFPVQRFGSSTKYIINFPTKRHWRTPSRIEDIEAGLVDLVRVINEHHIRSIAIPPLGAGNGGLDWLAVRPLIVNALASLTDVRIDVYEPMGAPEVSQIKIGTTRPAMTPGRAALILLLDQYARPGYTLTLLEIQKMAYFLQQAGEPMRLNFEKYQYGPYASNLNHVLQRIEGHYIRGYGDRTQSSAIELLPNAVETAQQMLATNAETFARLKRVAQVIEGFETPYGMELLATIHWVSIESPEAKQNWGAALQGATTWNERKKRIFRPEHVKLGWEQLQKYAWL